MIQTMEGIRKLSNDQSSRESLLAEREYLAAEARKLVLDFELAASINGLDEVIEELRAIRRRVIEIDRKLSLNVRS